MLPTLCANTHYHDVRNFAVRKKPEYLDSSKSNSYIMSVSQHFQKLLLFSAR